MVSARDDFSQPTKDLLAERAGYRCSVPNCPTRTVGPGAAAGESASIGVACHIFSAAPTGPRGQGGLTPEQLRAPENGFWACAKHGRLIDTNEGRRYPAATLFAWRDLAEARAHREMGGPELSACWIESVRVLESPHVFRAGEELGLSRVTLIVGNNWSGKSAICEWLAAAIEPRVAKRWEDAAFCVEIVAHFPEPHTIQLRHRDGEMLVRLDGKTVPFNPLPMMLQFLGRAPFRGSFQEGTRETDVAFLATWLHLEEGVVRALIKHIDYHGHSYIDSIRADEEGWVLAKLRLQEREWGLGALGTTGETMVAMAVAMARVDTVGPRMPALLIIDGHMARIDVTNTEDILEALMRMKHVQSIVTLPDELDERVAPGQWCTTFLLKGPEGTTISTGPTETA